MGRNGIIKNVVVAIALLLGASAQSFANSVPRRVLKQFNSMYPNADQVDWKKHNGFEADFRLNDKTESVVFNRRGDVVYSKEDVDLSQLPAPVASNLNDNFVDKGFKPEYAMHRWREKDGETYDITVNKGRDEYVLRYSADGYLVTQFNVSKMDKKASRIYFDD